MPFPFPFPFFFKSLFLTFVIFSAGAAGNFLASINQLSVNAFKSVIDIDVLGSYHTAKATLPYLKESAAKHRVDSNSCE
jgi:peroxisomal 2,4-dienoyl-CoA reductase